MTQSFVINLNTTRNGLYGLSPELRRERARACVKLLLVPRDTAVSVSERIIPDFMVSETMIDRYLEITPPVASVMPEFQEIIDEIEDAYVNGKFFSAISSACVSTERLLNLARIKLRKYHSTSKAVWRKDHPLNAWDKSIDPLRQWNYLDDDFAKELKSIYKHIRCRFLHSGTIIDMKRDAFRSVTAGYRLIKMFLGFPEDLFRFSSAIECQNPADPRFIEFYQPHLHSDSQE